MNALLPVVSIALSWLAGALVVRLLLPGRSDAHLAVQLGYGFFAGMALTVALVAGFRILGLGMHWLPVAGILVALSAAALFQGRRRAAGTDSAGGLRAWMSGAGRWQVGLLIALAAWVLARVLLVGLEAGLRPLYAWDGWMHWSPKAKVWIETGQWLEFVSRSGWLNDASRSAYTIRNWSYPEFVPLVQTWVLLPLERWDPVTFGYPWIAVFVALVPAAYGTARFSGFSPLAALLTAWLLVSLPFVHVHAALPGYADLWLGAYVGAAAGSLMLAASLRQLRWVLIAAVFGVVCAWIKVPGAAWMLVVLGGVLAYLLPARVTGLLVAGAFVALAVVLLIGVDLRIPGAGRVALSTAGFDLPVIGQYDWQFNRVFAVILGQLLQGGNWHFLWPACVIVYMIGIPAAIRDAGARAAWLLAALGACFLFAAFVLTSRGAAIESTQITHRAFLPLAILAVMTLPALVTATLRPKGRAESPTRNEPDS
ncbi:MAG: hypothetical protein GVY32_01140 [Gammaproteobacteria bacterium]|jgi:hypothetical protein|nr:hypothetical protein [Gammaproteobacteria bacterium]